MNVWVIDTSALLRLFLPDGPIPGGTEAAVRAVERGNGALLAPELVFAEAGQVLHRKVKDGILTSEECAALFKSILALPIQPFGHRTLLPRAMEIAEGQDLTVYDALFLALAEEYGCGLLTADRKLEKAARELLG